MTKKRSEANIKPGYKWLPNVAAYFLVPRSSGLPAVQVEVRRKTEVERFRCFHTKTSLRLRHYHFITNEQKKQYFARVCKTQILQNGKINCSLRIRKVHLATRDQSCYNIQSLLVNYMTRFSRNIAFSINVQRGVKWLTVTDLLIESGFLRQVQRKNFMKYLFEITWSQNNHSERFHQFENTSLNVYDANKRLFVSMISKKKREIICEFK